MSAISGTAGVSGALSPMSNETENKQRESELAKFQEKMNLNFSSIFIKDFVTNAEGTFARIRKKQEDQTISKRDWEMVSIWQNLFLMCSGQHPKRLIPGEFQDPYHLLYKVALYTKARELELPLECSTIKLGMNTADLIPSMFGEQWKLLPVLRENLKEHLVGAYRTSQAIANNTPGQNHYSYYRPVFLPMHEVVKKMTSNVMITEDKEILVIREESWAYFFVKDTPASWICFYMPFLKWDQFDLQHVAQGFTFFNFSIVDNFYMLKVVEKAAESCKAVKVNTASAACERDVKTVAAKESDSKEAPSLLNNPPGNKLVTAYEWFCKYYDGNNYVYSEKTVKYQMWDAFLSGWMMPPEQGKSSALQDKFEKTRWRADTMIFSGNGPEELRKFEEERQRTKHEADLLCAQYRGYEVHHDVNARQRWLDSEALFAAIVESYQKSEVEHGDGIEDYDSENDGDIQSVDGDGEGEGESDIEVDNDGDVQNNADNVKVVQ